MSKVIEGAVAALAEKAKGFDGTAKFVIEGEGSVYIDENGARAGDDEAEVTLTANRETFEGILSGDVNPTTAFMTGKLKVDGSMGTAMKLGALLS
ncbi:SCP-2 sterol transfer family protein [Paracoccus aminovorans]|uniref:SCP-2 sterol transfer family protein n=1 Tax=Paracoccus aminovorans TaxID=34004 RepID=A0A1I3CU83_9RHOB|nr:SCP2 sterol-binding domain-containing protein [Paracoccus aminovorans]CQR85917.1 sterol-binding domain-containing protein [Paracoccus aminovorans]SFH77791.1 SCP-2 sterol transfer family protein [Paracoccus aminovorans]